MYSQRLLTVAAACAFALTLAAQPALAEGEKQLNKTQMDRSSAHKNNSQMDTSSSQQRPSSERARMSETVSDRATDVESQEHKKLLKKASEVYKKLVDDTGIPRKLIQKTDCIAVVPNVQSRALLVGSQSGEGVISCKSQNNEWSSPAFISLQKTSLGAQIGMDSKDLVFFVVGKEQSKQFVDGSTTFGSGLNITAGPVGSTISQDFAINDGIYSYVTEEKGLFAGVSLTGGSVELNDELNESYYGKKISQDEAFTLSASQHAGQEAEAFRRSLPDINKRQ